MKEVQIKPDKKINCPMIVVWSFVPDHSLLLSPFFFVLNSGRPLCNLQIDVAPRK
jgi:hypothetical protein